jgi:hypothetical protein
MAYRSSMGMVVMEEDSRGFKQYENRKHKEIHPISNRFPLEQKKLFICAHLFIYYIQRKIRIGTYKRHNILLCGE